MDKAIIIGAGTYGQVYKHYLSDFYDITSFYDDDEKLHGKIIEGVLVNGSVDDALNNEFGSAVFVPIGDNSVRIRILKKFESKGFEIPSFIHPNTIVHKSVIVGKAVYILPGTNVMPLTVIKNYSMISMGVNIAHHTMIEEGCFFSQGTNIGASIHIKQETFIGIGATIMTGVNIIGENSLVGAGSLVLKDVPENAVIAGVPAKLLRFK